MKMLCKYTSLAIARYCCKFVYKIFSENTVYLFYVQVLWSAKCMYTADGYHVMIENRVVPVPTSLPMIMGWLVVSLFIYYVSQFTMETYCFADSLCLFKQPQSVIYHRNQYKKLFKKNFRSNFRKIR